MIAVKPKPDETPGSRWPIGPATSMMPASPASAPEIRKVKMTSRSALKPEKRAARGAAPTSRISNPMIMRPSSTVDQHDDDQRDDRAGVEATAFDQGRH